MARAIPIGQQQQQPLKEKKPDSTAAPVVNHDDYRGKDHPQFGKWNGHGWSRDA